MKHEGEDIESYENIKQRTLSPVKHKGEDVESFENIKTKDVESYET